VYEAFVSFPLIRVLGVLSVSAREFNVMKILSIICMLMITTSAWASESPASSPTESAVVKGEVLEVLNVENFTYLRLNTHAGEMWTAVINTPVKKGTIVTIKDVIVMSNFESKILKRTFPTILFGNLVVSGGDAHLSSNNHLPLVMGTYYLALAQKWDTKKSLHAPKSRDANVRTIAEIVKKADELKETTVVLSGSVVKYNPDIMGKNWVHLRDGSGSAADNTDDILVTTSNQVKLNDLVTFKGIVRISKDFGAGYAYKVLVEEATLQ
jgi:hypothetical protein